MSEEEKFEVINITIKTPINGESWFDRIMDFITADCQHDHVQFRAHLLQLPDAFDAR